MGVLKIKNLNFKYRAGFKNLNAIKKKKSSENNILKNVTLEINDGLNVLLGPNGTGKTTLMKILGTFFAFRDGDIYLDKLDYKKDIEDIREQIAYLPQDFKVYTNITGREFLKLISSLRNIENQEDKVNCIISELEMEEYIDKKVKTYSGGMNQKLGIAQLLIGEPKLMIIDEPTVGLDPEQRNIIREVLNEISNDRIVIVSTHIVEDIEVNCDNLIIMKNGKVLYQGNKKSLLELYKDKVYTTTIGIKEFRNFKSEKFIISKVQEENNYIIKYYSENKEENPRVNINLEEAYIICQNI